jgi:hypothetical protein
VQCGSWTATVTVEHLTMSDTFCQNALPADEEPVPIVPMVPARGSAGKVNEVKDGPGYGPGGTRAAAKATKKEMQLLANRVDAELDVCASLADATWAWFWTEMEWLEDLLEAAVQEEDIPAAREVLRTAERLRDALETAQATEEEGKLDGLPLEGRLLEKFMTVHFGAKPPLGVPRTSLVAQPEEQWSVARLMEYATEEVLGSEPNQLAATIAADSQVDRRFELPPAWRQYAAAETFNARGRRAPGGGGGGLVAGWSDVSEATTVLRVTAARMTLGGAKAEDEGVKYRRKVVCRHLSPSGMVHVFRYMDTHRPVKVGGGYRPPQDRPPPLVHS